MSVTVAGLRVKFPQFASTATYPDVLVDDRIQDAISQISEDYFGDLYDQAIYCLAAHEIVFLSGGLGSGYPVSSVSAGDASVGFAIPQNLSRSELNATTFGRQFMRLRRLCGPAATTGWGEAD